MTARVGIAITLMTISALALVACGPAPSGGKPAVEGTPWKLASYVNAEGKTVDVMAGSEITALFVQGQLAGNGGCNRYTGAYTLSGQQLTVNVGGVTMMYCYPEQLMAQETDYLAALSRAATYQVSENQLQVAGKDGAVILTYSALEPKPLVGTTWGLITYNNGKGALVSPLAGSEITAVFGTDGKVAGSAGCNTYNAAYQVDGLKISIGPAASTRMACAEPAGIMEQEAAYLAVLQTASRYQIEGDELVLFNGEGVKAAVFAARSAASAALQGDELVQASE